MTRSKNLFDKCVGFVKNYLSALNVDCSHDFDHIKRVWENACNLADKTLPQMELPSATENNLRQLISISALFHDISDVKYTTSYRC